MTYRLIESRTYLRSLELLSANARVSLPYALERIADNPTDMHRRRMGPDGSIVDYGAEGLLIGYRILDASHVRLLGVSDVKKAHRW